MTESSGKESQVALEAEITVMANQLYQRHQRGTGTVLLNSLWLWSGSASVQDYTGSRRTAQQDQERQGLPTIGAIAAQGLYLRRHMARPKAGETLIRQAEEPHQKQRGGLPIKPATRWISFVERHKAD